MDAATFEELLVKMVVARSVDIDSVDQGKPTEAIFAPTKALCNMNNFILIKFLYLVKCLLLNKLCKLKLYMCEGLLAVALMVTSSSGFNGDIIIRL